MQENVLQYKSQLKVAGTYKWELQTLIPHFLEYWHVQIICDKGGNGTKLIYCKDGNTANSNYYINFHNILCLLYRGADKSLAWPGRKQATETEDFDFHISYL